MYKEGCVRMFKNNNSSKELLNFLSEVIDKAKKYDELLFISGVNGTLSCSFCGKPQEAVDVLVRGYYGCICDECVKVAQKLIERKISDKNKEE